MKSFPRPLQQYIFAIRSATHLRPSQPQISNARIVAPSINTSRTRRAFSTDPALRKDRLDGESPPRPGLPQQSPPSTDHLPAEPSVTKALPTDSLPIELSSIQPPPIEHLSTQLPPIALPIGALPIKTLAEASAIEASAIETSPVENLPAKLLIAESSLAEPLSKISSPAEPLPREVSLAESSPEETSLIVPPITKTSSTENSPIKTSTQEHLNIGTAPTEGSLSEPSPVEASPTERSPTEIHLPAETVETLPAESSLEENLRVIHSSVEHPSGDHLPIETPPVGAFRTKAGPTESSLAESSPTENSTEIQTSVEDSTSVSAQHDPASLRTARLPRSVQAIYLKPLKRKAQYGLPVCDLQLRSYSVRNLEFFADFALRAAYYLYLPASGPVPLPRITERWTVPRSSFIFKKSQENFQRITLRRLIQIQDGNPETVEIWLAFLRKHAYHGIGMKANVWAHEKLGVGKTMDVSLQNMKHVLEPKWAHFGRRKNVETSEKVFQIMSRENFRQTEGDAMVETGIATGTPTAATP